MKFSAASFNNYPRFDNCIQFRIDPAHISDGLQLGPRCVNFHGHTVIDPCHRSGRLSDTGVPIRQRPAKAIYHKGAEWRLDSGRRQQILVPWITVYSYAQYRKPENQEQFLRMAQLFGQHGVSDRRKRHPSDQSYSYGNISIWCCAF